MNKLFRLKEWVTIPEAARHLSQILEESISEADVLQLALDKQIKISVIFPNGAFAKVGIAIPLIDTEVEEYAGVINFEDEIVLIKGLWDLPMIGDEWHDTNSYFQELIHGPEVSFSNSMGTYLNRRDGHWAALFDQVSGNAGSNECRLEINTTESFVPAERLGTDCLRVIRTDEILAFQSRLNEGLHETTSLTAKPAAIAVNLDSDINPEDLPEELDLANMAYRAVSKSLGVKTGTFRNRVKDYLKQQYPHLKPEVIERIATVANPDKSRGRK